MRRIAALGLVLGIAGCASGVPVEREYVVPGGGFSNVQGESRLNIRTFVEQPDGPREVLGAACDVTTSLFAQPVTTPARLVVPNFGPQSPELAVTCRAGEFSGEARQRIVTRWQYPPRGAAPGWGARWGGPGWRGDWWGQPAYPVFGYPDMRVILR